MQSRRKKAAAKKFFHKLLRGCEYIPHLIITDKLGSYGAAKREVLVSVQHGQDLCHNCPTPLDPTPQVDNAPHGAAPVP